MGLTAKQTGKFEGMLRKIENDQEARAKELRVGKHPEKAVKKK